MTTPRLRSFNMGKRRAFSTGSSFAPEAPASPKSCPETSDWGGLWGQRVKSGVQGPLRTRGLRNTQSYFPKKLKKGKSKESSQTEGKLFQLEACRGRELKSSRKRA